MLNTEQERSMVAQVKIWDATAAIAGNAKQRVQQDESSPNGESTTTALDDDLIS